jgi:hypothetical protein
MDDVYTSLTDEPLRDVQSMKSVVERITEQTLECSYFILEYSKNEQFRKLRLCRIIAIGELTCPSRDKVYEQHNV